MPVPVPRLSKPVAHPVNKPAKFGDENLDTTVFPSFASSFPASPAGPPPSFGTREQWINSLPHWRRTKPRRIWEDDAGVTQPEAQRPFRQGLTVADNAPVIKGTRAQACIPPFGSLVQSLDAVQPTAADTSAQFGHIGSQTQATHTAYEQQDAMDVEQPYPQSSDFISQEPRAVPPFSYPRSPLFQVATAGVVDEDTEPSPIEPVTPFAEFVDREVATSCQAFDALSSPNFGPDTGYPHATAHGAVTYYAIPQAFPQAPEPPKDPAPAAAPVSEVVTPSASPGYRKLAEPLSEWIANYVWKVCTTGYSLPPVYARTTVPANYAAAPPSYLAGSVHSLLLSTLLQPSAIFLAMWYIVHLPVHFNGSGMGADHTRELRFRAALLEDGAGNISLETAPLRVVVLGCMLANKWLDDHTFSNKTWHSISNVPIHLLNNLESLSLDIFAYDISVSPQEWSRWLAHLLSYHLSLSSPGHPQPISRPSTNPYAIIRKSLEEIMEAPKSATTLASSPQPVFLGLEARKQEKLEKEQAMEALEINLDEDGPLREEYIPKRRTSRAGSTMGATDIFSAPTTQSLPSVQYAQIDLAKVLPPPAKWSPAADEPIRRDSNRASGHYIAVQPPVPAAPLAPYPPYQHNAYHQVHPNSAWGPNSGYTGLKHSVYQPEIPAFYNASQTVYAPFQFIFPSALSHSRSQSLSYDQDTSRSHARSYSQAQFEYRCSDIRMTANELAPPSEHWGAPPAHLGHYPFPAQTFAPHPALHRTCYVF
ncbi:hypothetical protein HGRIS_009923 [Hohenbuehelia grisea]|uniref:Cyclin N-terminal domain-containing protein n=1 Tax=Hohenbuehelia grisea TaxID=104357 RepID=A0ABR3J2R2_9AGAR